MPVIASRLVINAFNTFPSKRCNDQSISFYFRLSDYSNLSPEQVSSWYCPKWTLPLPTYGSKYLLGYPSFVVFGIKFSRAVLPFFVKIITSPTYFTKLNKVKLLFSYQVFWTLQSWYHENILSKTFWSMQEGIAKILDFRVFENFWMFVVGVSKKFYFWRSQKTCLRRKLAFPIFFWYVQRGNKNPGWRPYYFQRWSWKLQIDSAM